VAALGLALAIDAVILEASRRHHGRSWPLSMCVLGGATALLGHFAESSLIEYVGLAALLGASIANVVCLRRHHRHSPSCCNEATAASGLRC
jgi:hypothetical protein